MNGYDHPAGSFAMMISTCLVMLEKWVFGAAKLLEMASASLSPATTVFLVSLSYDESQTRAYKCSHGPVEVMRPSLIYLHSVNAFH
ncbi:hypothetical protein KIN20_031277 [Parelaphostrongylus tenuis]|uniref:Uncharacterized protein n=1 Tax=Parelaphostrongylus tenuis TaxID=148309 RepID=A0AAD5R5B4_PARTN|nr:hypothetical protein KIN20_031277 [Parelaphostrongylus tenuis]